MISMSKLKKTIVAAFLLIMPFLFFIASICIGRYSVSVGDVLKSIISAVSGNKSAGIDYRTYTVITEIRIPRAILSVLVGASLAASGAAFQSIFRNPLVSSGMLGVSNGAGFGAALSIILFGNVVFASPFAFVFAILAVILSYLVGKVSGGSPTITLILGGTIIQSIFSSLISLLKFAADTDSQLPAITFWLMGSLASTKDSDMLLSGIPMILGMTGLFLMRWRLNVLSMGDREARTLGIDAGKNKAAVIGFATLATAGAVCVSGVVGWVGLIVPHIGRMIIGSDNKWLIPFSISFGACFVLMVDTICRSVTGTEIPLGIITALVGSPIFIYLLKKTKGKSW
jgi:iron complex transport system permease protein